jgi:hypothetical protein
MKCYCGKPLHYTDGSKQKFVQKLVDELGEFIPVTVPSKGTFLVQRHYIALHGIKGENIETLGFKKLA